MARSTPRYTPPPTYAPGAPVAETYNDPLQGLQRVGDPPNPFFRSSRIGNTGIRNVFGSNNVGRSGSGDLSGLYEPPSLGNGAPSGSYGGGGAGNNQNSSVGTLLNPLIGAGVTNFGTAESGSVGQPIPVTPNDPMQGVPTQSGVDDSWTPRGIDPVGGYPDQLPPTAAPWAQGLGWLGVGAGAATNFGSAEGGGNAPQPQANPPAAGAPASTANTGYDPYRAEDMGGSVRSGIVGADGKPGLGSEDVQRPILTAEGTYRPEYADLDLKDINQYAEGMADTTANITNRYGEMNANANTAQREADMTDVEGLGGRATEAFRNANPELVNAQNAAQGLGGASNYYADAENAVKNTPKYGDVGYNDVSYNNVGAGALGNDIQNEAMGARGLGAAGSRLDARAQQFANSTGELSRDELRGLQQSVREGYASRGTAMGTGSVTAEALSRLTNQRGRMMEDIGMASDLRTANQGELESNRNFRTGAQRDDVARQQDNSLRNLDADLSNQKYNASTQIENRNFQADQYQQYLDNLMGTGDKRRTQNQDDRAYSIDLVGMQERSAINPFEVVQNNRSNAPTAARGSVEFASGMAPGPKLFDPSGAVDVDLTANRNDMEYNANKDSANASIEASRKEANANTNAGLLDGAISVVGKGLDIYGNILNKPKPKTTTICWVAREVYGSANPKWLEFRSWLLNLAPRWFYKLYVSKGEAFAEFISNKPRLKSIIRKWMDGRIKTLRETNTRTAEAIS